MTQEQNNINKVIREDCLEVLKTLPQNSVDSIVTDPPYELGFMGKSWDKTGIANNVELWKECLRVLKPGGHLLAFSGTRTYHRMASAIEDAGFEVRDMIEWVYGSGFPKSLNIGKAVDKLQGNEREVLGTRKVPDQRSGGINSERTAQMGVPTRMTTDTKGTSEWEGWGTALKPAHEPICMARKPLAEKNVANNVLKWGTGGINIDESRVEANKNDKFGGGGLNSPVNGFMGNTESTYKKGTGFRDDTHLGRFPANLIHDNSEEVRECFPESNSGKGKASTYEKFGGQWGKGKQIRNEDYGDSGNASRFFKSIIYTAKASKSERNKGCEELEEIELRGGGGRAEQGYDDNDPEQQRLKDAAQAYGAVKAKKSNFHPTVKPIALMEYLIKMVTPKTGLVLDPFAGSGSTLVAAKQNGFQYIGIEMMEEYISIIKARLNN